MSDNKITDSFKHKLDSARKTIDEDKYRRRVLALCQQAEPRSFEEYSSSGSFRKLEKFESSTYSEVLKAIDLNNDNRPVVMKIMRALSRGLFRKLPTSTIKGCQAFDDILNELVITQALSQLHDGVLLDGKLLYKTHFFCMINEIKVVTGNLERILSKSSAITTKTINQQQIQDANKENEKHHEKKDEQQKEEKSDDISDEDRMLIEALPREYVISVMRHDGHPLWWMMTHKKLTAEQLSSILTQTIIGIAIAEKVYQYEHRDLHVSNILIKKTAKTSIPFVVDSNRYRVATLGMKATIIDATFSRLTFNQKVYYRDLTSTLRAYGTKKVPVKMSLQNRSYREMVHITNNNWQEFAPKTNLIWLTYLCETMMKNDILKASPKLLEEVTKIRDFTVKVKTTIELLNVFPFEKDTGAAHKSSLASKVVSKVLSKFT